MAEKITKKWNTPLGLNLVLLGFLFLLMAAALVVSFGNLFILPLFMSEEAQIKDIEALPQIPAFGMLITGGAGALAPVDSPYNLDLSIATPPLAEGDAVRVVAVSGGKAVAVKDCLEDFNASSEYAGSTSLACAFQLPYNYLSAENVKLIAVYKNAAAGTRNSAPPVSLSVNWSGYETSFWGSSFIILIFALAGLAVVAIVAGIMMYFSTRIEHEVERGGEYTIGSLLSPIEIAKQAIKDPRSIVSSPVFWVFQAIGILVVLLYLFVDVTAWKSASSLYAFFISGIFAFIIPFLLSAILWFVDYKEREPLRIIVSLFLWGGLACLLSIGFNSSADMIFSAVGLGALTAFIVAPLVEETMKGTGLVILSFHHEYDDMVDGIIYGFIIGMGFAFVENWLYFLKMPLGGNIFSWLFLFFLRSIVFAANHGVFTAFTGGVIGYLKQKHVGWAPYGLLIGVIPAMLLHAIHNSGEIWGGLCGPAGVLFHLFVIAPVFDYGCLVLVMVALVLGVLFSATQDASRLSRDRKPVTLIAQRGGGEKKKEVGKEEKPKKK